MSRHNNITASDRVESDGEGPATGAARWWIPGSSRKVGFLLLALFAASLLLRTINLGEKSLWVDEGASAVIAASDIATIVSDGKSTHPPGYYTMLHYVSELDDSEASLRFPSALASSIAVALIYLLGRVVMSSRAALFAAGLAMLSPLDLWYAQEARQPALATLAVVGGFYGLSREGWGGKAVALAGLLGGLYMDYVTAVGWLVAGAVWTYFWWNKDRQKVRDWASVTVVGGVIFALFLGAAFSNGFLALLGNEGAGIWYKAILGSNPFTSTALGMLVTIYVVSLLGSFLVGNLVTSTRSRLWAALLIVGYGAVVALTPIPRAFSVKKVVVVAWPVVIIGIAYLVWNQLSPRWRSRGVVGLLAISALGFVGALLVPKDDWRGAVEYVNAMAQPGDIAWVSTDPWADNAYLYYNGSIPVMRDANPDGLVPTDGDIWLITMRRPQDPIPALDAEEWFDANWKFVDERTLYRLGVRHYEGPGE